MKADYFIDRKSKIFCSTCQTAQVITEVTNVRQELTYQMHEVVLECGHSRGGVWVEQRRAPARPKTDTPKKPKALRVFADTDIELSGTVEIAIENGYQLCACGIPIVAGEKALTFGDTQVFMHKQCASQNPAPEWKVARRVAAYQSTNPDATTPEHWENVLLTEQITEFPRESQFDFTGKSDDGDGGQNEGVPNNGARWNGNVVADCREFLNEMAVKCDRPRVARLMEAITECQILREERADLYATGWDAAKLTADEAAVKYPFVDDSDQRTSVGKDGGQWDDLPSEAADYDDTPVAPDPTPAVDLDEYEPIDE